MGILEEDTRNEDLLARRATKRYQSTEVYAKAQREAFLNDQLIHSFDDLLSKVYSLAIPTYVVSNNTLKRVFDLRTQNRIDKIIDNRNEYIKTKYGF